MRGSHKVFGHAGHLQTLHHRGGTMKMLASNVPQFVVTSHQQANLERVLEEEIEFIMNQSESQR
jgi:hypothetical protein